MPSEWRTVTLQRPCPVCKRPNAQHKSRWCRYTTDGLYAWCPHTPGNGNGKDRCVYRLRAERPAATTGCGGYNYEPQRERVIDWEGLNAVFVKGCTDANRELLAKNLGVAAVSLTCLRVGQCDQGIFTFPMTNGRHRIVGVRTRGMDGVKRAVYGSHGGLFLPQGIEYKDDLLIVCEGPTDTAAMLTLGLRAIGRADCTHTRYTEVVCADSRVVIMADPDEAGRRGAAVLRDHLKRHRISSAIVVPPAKDARAWLNAGATKADVLRLIGDAA